MKHLSLLMAVFIFSAASAAAESPPKTVIQDQAEAERLLGKHLFADNALGDVLNYGYPWTFGTARVSKQENNYVLSANMECYTTQNLNPEKPRGGHTHLQGNIINISKNKFTVKGSLEFMYLSGTPWETSKRRSCHTQGIFVFSRKHAYPQDIDKDFWFLVRPENFVDSNRTQRSDTDCLKYIYPLRILVEKNDQEPEEKFCSFRLEDFRKH